jgi:hypothetical protein
MQDMRSRADKAGFDLSGGSFFLPPDHELYLQWTNEFRERRDAAQKQFDPLHMKPPGALSVAVQTRFDPHHMKPPLPLSVPQRRTIETASCRIN